MYQTQLRPVNKNIIHRTGRRRTAASRMNKPPTERVQGVMKEFVFGKASSQANGGKDKVTARYSNYFAARARHSLFVGEHATA
jgi:hypothetical protein